MSQENTLVPAQEASLYQPLEADRGTPFGDPAAFKHYYRIASMFAASSLVPEHLRHPDRVPDVMIALDMARRIDAQPIAVMQAITNIKGNSGWRSNFLIALAKKAGWDLDWEIEELSPALLQYKRNTKNGQVPGTMPDLRIRCVMERAGRTRYGPWVSSQQAIAARWADNEQYTHSADVMLRYRAAAFCVRLHDPGLLFGLMIEEELREVIDSEPAVPSSATVIDRTLDRTPEPSRYTAGLAELDRQTAAQPAPASMPPPLPSKPAPAAPARPAANPAQDAEILLQLVGSGREIATILPAFKAAIKVDRLRQERVNATIAWAINAGRLSQQGEMLYPVVTAAQPAPTPVETIADPPIKLQEPEIDVSLLMDKIGDLEGDLGWEAIGPVATAIGITISESGEPNLDGVSVADLVRYAEALQSARDGAR